MAVLSLIVTFFFLGFFLSAVAARVRLLRGVSEVCTVTVDASLQLTVMTSGLPAPPLPPGRSPETFTAHAGGTLSTKVASAEACGSAAWRTPSLLKSRNATTVSAPALVPGSVITALPFASRVAVPETAFDPGDRVAQRPARVGHAVGVEGS